MKPVIIIAIVVGIGAIIFLASLFIDPEKEQAILNWNDGFQKCKILGSSGAPVYAYNQCIIEHTKEILETCKKFPEFYEQCEAVKEIVRNEPIARFLLD